MKQSVFFKFANVIKQLLQRHCRKVVKICTHWRSGCLTILQFTQPNESLQPPTEHKIVNQVDDKPRLQQHVHCQCSMFRLHYWKKQTDQMFSAHESTHIEQSITTWYDTGYDSLSYSVLIEMHQHWCNDFIMLEMSKLYSDVLLLWLQKSVCP